MCVKLVHSWADTTGNSSEVPIPKGLARRCQEDPQPLPCGGQGLWLCPGPAAATDRWVWNPGQPSQLYLAGGGKEGERKVVVLMAAWGAFDGFQGYSPARGDSASAASLIIIPL